MLKGGSVLKLFVKALGLIVTLVISGAACAIGMGGINVTTALGEPLNAEIELVAVGKADKNKMSARLASPDVFKGAGLDYPSGLPTLKFQIETRANGEPYLKLTSTQPVNEPFVSLLVELTGSSGQLLREYTFLLDPPGFKPEQPKAVEVKPLEPSVASAGESKSSESNTASTQEQSAPMRATAPMDEKVFAKAGVVAPAKKPAESSNAASGTIKVKRGDTLSKIVNETKSSDVSLERMMVAMYRANEDAFDGNNMNRLKTGKILRVPDNGDLNKVAQVDAVKEIHLQAADWHAYRMKLAAASGSVAEQAPKQEASGKISTMVADKTPVAKESSKEVVRLSKGAAPGDKAATGGSAQAMQDKLHAMEEDTTARNKALNDSNERIAMLETNIKAMQRLIELKGQSPVAPTQPALSKADVPVPSKAAEQETKPEIKPGIQPEIKPDVNLEAASAVAQSAVPVSAALPAASAVSPAKPVVPKIETPAPSLLDTILGEPLYLAGGAAALLGLGGIGFMLTRRRKGGKPTDSVVAYIAEPVAPSPDTGDFTQTATATPISTAGSENVDPISEADLFLNFGRDVQAEEILKDALHNNPGNQQVRLKLLSIYANRKDTKTFSSIARQVQDSGDHAAWAQAAEMGRKLEPSNPMYGGDDHAAEATGKVSLDEVKTERASLDFDLGFGVPEASPAESNAATAALDVPLEVAPEAAATSSGLDFDLGLSAPAEIAPVVEENPSAAVPSVPQSEKADTASALDFDLGFDVPPEPEASIPAETGYESTMVLGSPPNVESKAPENFKAAQETPLDFDITTTHPDLSAQQAEQIDFDISAKYPDFVPQSSEQALEQAELSAPSLDDLIFDVTATHPSPVAMMEDIAAVEAPAAAEDAMEFTLDFPTAEESTVDDKVVTAPAQTVVKETSAIDLSEINLNLDAPVSAPVEEVKDARWQDVATKLDLARAYQEMGDASGAREILEEVLNEGDAQQRAAAEVMLQQLSA
jgi:pilus assembly protein FimV